MATTNPMIPTPTMPGAGYLENLYRGAAMSQLAILRQEMKLGGLVQGQRQVRLDNGAEVLVQISYNHEQAFVRVPARGGAETAAVEEIPLVILPIDFELSVHTAGDSPYTQLSGWFYLQSGTSYLYMAPITLFAPTGYTNDTATVGLCASRTVEGIAYPAQICPPGYYGTLSAEGHVRADQGLILAWPWIKVGEKWLVCNADVNTSAYVSRDTALRLAWEPDETGKNTLWLYQYSINGESVVDSVLTATFSISKLRVLLGDSFAGAYGPAITTSTGVGSIPIGDTYTGFLYRLLDVSPDGSGILVMLENKVASHITNCLIELTVNSEVISVSSNTPSFATDGSGTPNVYWLDAWYHLGVKTTMTYEVTSRYTTESISTFNEEPEVEWPEPTIGYSSIDSLSKAEIVIGARRIICHLERHRTRQWGTGSQSVGEGSYTRRTEHAYSHHSAVMRGFDRRTGVMGYYEQATAIDFDSSIESRFFTAWDVYNFSLDSGVWSLTNEDSGFDAGVKTRVSNKLEYFDGSGLVSSSTVFGSRLYDTDGEKGFTPVDMADDGFTLPNAADATEEGAFVSMFVAYSNESAAGHFWIPIYDPPAISVNRTESSMISVPRQFLARTTAEGRKFVLFVGDASLDADGWPAKTYIRNDILGEDSIYSGSSVLASPTYQMLGTGQPSGTYVSTGKVFKVVWSGYYGGGYEPAYFVKLFPVAGLLQRIISLSIDGEAVPESIWGPYFTHYEGAYAHINMYTGSPFRNGSIITVAYDFFMNSAPVVRM